MNVRTVSSLPEASAIQNNDLLQVSHYIAPSTYASQKISYETLNKKIKSDYESNLNRNFNIKSGTINDINKDISEHTTAISGINTNISNLNTRVTDLTNNTPTWRIKNTKTFIDPSSCTVNKDSSQNFYNFSFSTSTNVTNNNTITKTGNLFCYGWLTAPKVIDPADAWVAIEAKISNEKWMMIALSPWIIGEKSNILQYVGFNCPVQKDLIIRIRSGFKVADNSRSFANRGLIFNVTSTATRSNINNTFIGYILG